MRYPIFIEPETDTTVFGVAVPDLPGCFSAGDTLDEAIEAVQEAAALWIDSILEFGEPIPNASSLEDARNNPDYADWILGVIDLETDSLKV